MSHLFISYSRRDNEEVTRIAQALKDAGHTVWLDTSAIQGGASWQSEIVRGIADADVFVLMLSPDAVKSENVEREVGLAYTTGKSILPVMLHRTEVLERLKYAISELEVVNISDVDIRVASECVLNALVPSDPWGRHASTFISVLLIAFFAAGATQADWPPPFSWFAWVVLTTSIAYLISAPQLFGHMYRAAFARRLNRRSVVLSSRFKGMRRVTIGFGYWITSEWSDPQSGKCYEFYSPPLWRAPLNLIPKEIRVIADPHNLHVYRMDISFLRPFPKPIGGVWKAVEKDQTWFAEMRGARQVFVSHSEADSDKEPVEVLIRGLQASGYVMSTRSVPQGDTSSQSSQERVIQRIQEAPFFLIVLSEESVRTDRVQKELDFAVAHRKRVIAAVVGRPEVPSHMAYALAGVRRVDLSNGLHANVAPLLEAMAADSSPGTVIYKPDRLAAIRDSSPAAAIDIFLGILVVPFVFLWMLLGRHIWQHLGADYRSSLASWVVCWRRRFEVRFGIWSRHDLRTRGITLRTEYKHTEDGDIVSQWRDPVSNELYSFRRRGPSVSNLFHEPRPSQALIGLKTITVYANPENLSQYYMDLPFLSKEAENPQAARAGDEILLSYSEQNSKEAIALSFRLKAEGFTVFDLREMQRDEILGSSETLVLIIPPPGASDLASRLEDLRAASKLGKSIVPVILGNTGAVPLSMQYALAGVQHINLGDDLHGSTGLLLKALGRVREVAPPTGSGTERQKYPVRTRSTGAWIGALCYGFGSILPAFLMHGRSRDEVLLGGLIAGLVCGACAGAFMKPRIQKRQFIFNGMFFVAFGLGLIYFPAYDFLHSLIRAEKPIESMRGEAIGATLVGFLVFFAGKLLEDRFLIRRLRRQGRLLLTEYRRFDETSSASLWGTHIVSEWCDPETRQVHVFQGATRGHDVSKLVRTGTIAVFVNPDNFTDYFMDFSFEPAGVACRPVAASHR